MSAEEWISYTLGGCNSNDMDDAADGCSGQDSYQDFGGASNSEYETRNRGISRYTAGDKKPSLTSQVIKSSYNLVKSNKENKMKVSALITKNTVQVKFVGQTQNDKEYSYLTDIMDMAVSDLVVVDTMYGFKTAIVTKVQALSKTARDTAIKWIVCRVDTEEFKSKLEKYELVQEIENELEEEMASFNRIKYYQAAAEVNPRIGELINKLTDLTGGVKEVTDESKA